MDKYKNLKLIDDLEIIKNTLKGIEQEVSKGLEKDKNESNKEVSFIDLFKEKEQIDKKILVNIKLKEDVYKRLIRISEKYNLTLTEMLEDTLDSILDDDKNNNLMEVFIDENLKNNLIDLGVNYNRIMEMLNTHEEKSIPKYDNIIEINLRNKLLREKEKNVRTTVKINEDILKDFDKYCNQHKQYLKQDLLSAALYEFLNARNFYNEKIENK